MARNEYKHERQVLSSYGFRQNAGSGNQWHSPEDGEDEHFLVQMKSTQKKAITVKEEDVKDLLAHAITSHKIPLFLLDINGTHLFCVPYENVQDLIKIEENKHV